MRLDWFFAERAGAFKVDNFGGKSFGGPMFATESGFSGPLIGTGLAVGAANGAFAGPRAGQAPTGVYGNFGVGNRDWKANGIFGGGHVGPVPYANPGIANN